MLQGYENKMLNLSVKIFYSSALSVTFSDACSKVASSAEVL